MSIYSVVSSFVSRLGPYIIALVIAAVSFVGGSVTDTGEAVQLAINPDKALEQAAKLINETPPAEVEKALAE